MRTVLVSLAALLLTAALGLFGCADETVYDWQRPHETYQVGTFSQSKSAEELQSKLRKSGFESRIATELKDGQFYLNVLVDVYSKQPDTLAKLESVAGMKPHLLPSKAGNAPTAPAPIPAKDI